MSNAIACDQCESVLVVDARGEDAAGECAAWIKMTMNGVDYDFCTRSCVAEFLVRPEVIEAHNAHLATIADIARMIAEESA